MSIAVAVNKILTDSEKEELKNLVLSASGVDYSRGDVISVSGLQFEGAAIDKQASEDFTKQYQREQLIETVTSSVIPLIIVLVLGCFALIVLKSFISKLPTAASRNERKSIEENIVKAPAEEDEPAEIAPRVEFNKKEIQSQKDQNITELNEAIMASPEDAAKLITSYIRE